MSTAQLYAKYIGLKYAARMAYKTDFFISTITFGFFQITTPIFFLVLHQAGAQFPGWTIEQVLLLTGFVTVTRGFAFMAFYGIFWKTIQLVQNGTFDILLLRPQNTFMLLLMEGFDEEDIGQFIAGGIIFAVGWHLTGPHTGSLLLAAAFMVAALLFMLGMASLCAGLSIRFVRPYRLYELIDLVGIFASYPKTIYQGTASIVLSLIVPAMVIGYYPASSVLGLPSTLGLWALLVAILWGIGGILFWHISLKHYRSAGG